MSFPAENAATEIKHAGRVVRLKWHKLRQCAEDPPFSRRNLRAGLAAGASLEVDIRPLACGRFVCLHDAQLEHESTGRGPVAAVDAAAIARLRMREAPSERPLLLDELVDIVGGAPTDPRARVQLDLCVTAEEIDTAAARGFTRALHGLAERFILGGYDWEAVTRLGKEVVGLALGYDPTEAAGAFGGADVLRLVQETAPEADTIYLHRKLVRSSRQREDGLVERLRERGHRVDCWTIDHGTPGAAEDLQTAIDAGCDEITTNTPRAWAAAVGNGVLQQTDSR